MTSEPYSPFRVRYSKVERDILVFVIADIRPDGAEFFSQETGEVRWYPFIPAAQERAAALALHRFPPPSETGWPLLFAGDSAAE